MTQLAKYIPCGTKVQRSTSCLRFRIVWLISSATASSRDWSSMLATNDVLQVSVQNDHKPQQAHLHRQKPSHTFRNDCYITPRPVGNEQRKQCCTCAQDLHSRHRFIQRTVTCVFENGRHRDQGQKGGDQDDCDDFWFDLVAFGFATACSRLSAVIGHAW